MSDFLDPRNVVADALNLGDDLFSVAFKFIPIALGITELDQGRFLAVNAAFEEIYGYSIEDLQGQRAGALSIWAKPEDRARVIAAMANGKPIRSHEIPILRKDQTLRWVSYTGQTIEFKGQTCILSAAVDITERKRAEADLKERDQLLDLFIQNAPAAIVMLDRDMRYIFASNRWLQDFRLEFQTIVGRSHYDVFPEIPERWKAIHRRCLEGATERCEEDPFPRKDGLLDWVKWEIRPWTDSAGEIGGIIIMSEDVTERKRAAQALKESEERFRGLFETAPVSYLLFHRDGTTLAVNRQFQETFGYGLDEVPTIEAWWALALPDPATLAEARHAWASLWTEAAPAPGHFERRIRSKDGTLRTVEASVVRQGDQVLVADFDLTDRLRAEAEQRRLQTEVLQAQKMESVGRLAGGVAHDFNNMLGVIMGHSEVALLTPGVPAAMTEHFEEIKKAARRSGDLTRQLLAFARKQTAIPKVLDLDELLANLLKMLRRLIGEDIRLDLLPSPGLWSVRIDPSQVDQIMVNLVVNARDAIQGHGRITIEARNVTLDEAACADDGEARPGEFVRIKVQDDGHGMGPSTLAHLFEPFFTTKGLGQGTGLGLSTVYGIVKQNEGFLEVESREGLGSTFLIHLPRFKGAASPLEASSPATEPGGRGETILLVEDELATLAVERTMLEHLGYRVLATQSPAEALRLGRHHPGDIRLLITDVIMPEMNGRELSEALVALRPGMACLFTSGYPADIIAPKGILEEGLSFLPKPLGMKDLARRVRDLIP